MSAGKLLLWAAVILIVAYAFNINIPLLIGDLFHGLQQVHNNQAH